MHLVASTHPSICLSVCLSKAITVEFGPKNDHYQSVKFVCFCNHGDAVNRESSQSRKIMYLVASVCPSLCPFVCMSPL